MFVSSDGLIKAFAIGETAEVERASPAVLIQVCGKVVIVSCEGCVFCFSSLFEILRHSFKLAERGTCLSNFCSLGTRRLVVPMLEVFL